MHSRRRERRQKKVVQPVGHLTKSCLLPESAAACLSELSSQPKDVFLVMVMLSMIDSIAHGIAFFNIVKRDSSNIPIFFEDPFFGSNFLQTLDVFKHSIDDLICVCKSLLR